MKEIKMKICIACNEAEVTGKREYCTVCKSIRMKAYHKNRSMEIQRKKTVELRKKLDDNFLLLNPTGLDMLPSNFNRISEIPNITYQRNFGIRWIEVLRVYNKEEELIATLLQEYKKYYEETGFQQIKEFAKSIGTSETFMKNFDHNHFREHIGVRRLKNSIEDYKINFNRIKEVYGRAPMFGEFKKHTEIYLNTYADKFALKGVVYDEIVKMFCTEDEYQEYKINHVEYRIVTGKENHQGHTVTMEELENEFKRVFDETIELAGKNPSMKVFSELSLYDESTYRGRLNLSFGEVVEYYGYNFDATSNKSEKLVVETIGKILGELPIPQQTFEWLLSTKDWKMRCDGYYPLSRLVVEFDGRQHYEPVSAFGGMEAFINLQANDAIKNSLIPQHGLSLVRISCYDPYWDEDFLKFRLLESNISPPNYTIVYDSEAHKCVPSIAN